LLASGQAETPLVDAVWFASVELRERRHGFTMPFMLATSQESARDVVVMCVVAAALSPVGDVSAARPGAHPRPTEGGDAMPVTTSRSRRRRFEVAAAVAPHFLRSRQARARSMACRRQRRLERVRATAGAVISSTTVERQHGANEAAVGARGV